MKKIIALFVHQPKCSIQSGNGIIKALSPHYEFKIFTKHEVEDNFFDGVHAVAFPGGIGDADSWLQLFGSNLGAIRNFVHTGGCYLGICMGAYWAGSHYFDILRSVQPEQYIRRPYTDTKRPHAKNLNVLWEDTPQKMFFYDGCALVGDTNQFQTVATYMNGDPMAIIQDNIGLIGCHPESESHWYDSYSWMRGLYHDDRHHTLLLNFVDKLMKD